MGLARILISAIVVSTPAGIATAAQRLSYEPSIVRLDGTVEAKERFGPPGYGEKPETDHKVVVPILRLTQPVAVQGDPKSELNSATEEDVTEIQLILPPRYDPIVLVGQRVAVTGSLFHAHTGHHATRVLMNVRTIMPGK